MTRVLGVLLLGAVGVSAAPVPKAVKKKADYFPLAAGNKWEFQSDKDGTRTTRELTAVTDHPDGSRTARVQDGKLTGEYRADADGVGFSEWGGKSIDPVMRFLAAKLTPGHEWECRFRYSNSDWHYTFTVGEAEEVTVPAGTFRAVPVTSRRMGNGGKVDDTYVDWYAAGVGPVKTKSQNGTVKELVKFTPGK